MNAIKLNAGNDRNGNPRRVFVVLDDDGHIIASLDEGYDGTAILLSIFPKLKGSIIPTFDTSVKEYKRMLLCWRASKVT